MSNHHGNEGVVKIGANVVAEVTEFSIEETQEVADDSAMGDTWRTHKTGLKSWRSTITAHWDETDTTGQNAMTTGASVTANLYPEGDGSGDTYFTGTGTIERIQRQNNMNGIISATFDVAGNGALTKTTV